MSYQNRSVLVQERFDADPRTGRPAQTGCFLITVNPNGMLSEAPRLVSFTEMDELNSIVKSEPVQTHLRALLDQQHRRSHPNAGQTLPAASAGAGHHRTATAATDVPGFQMQRPSTATSLRNLRDQEEESSDRPARRKSRTQSAKSASTRQSEAREEAPPSRRGRRMSRDQGVLSARPSTSMAPVAPKLKEPKRQRFNLRRNQSQD